MVWRIVDTRDGTIPLLFWTLWSAELIGWLSLTLFVRDSWAATESYSEPVPFQRGDDQAAVDVLIPTYDEALNVLEPTVLGASLIRGSTTIWVLDDGDRPWVEDLCARLGLAM